DHERTFFTIARRCAPRSASTGCSGATVLVLADGDGRTHPDLYWEGSGCCPRDDEHFIVGVFIKAGPEHGRTGSWMAGQPAAPDGYAVQVERLELSSRHSAIGHIVCGSHRNDRPRPRLETSGCTRSESLAAVQDESYRPLICQLNLHHGLKN